MKVVFPRQSKDNNCYLTTMLFKHTALCAFIFLNLLNHSCARVTSLQNSSFNRSLVSGLTQNILRGLPSTGRSFFTRIRTGAQFCGGSVIGRKWILTSATCIYQHANKNIIVELAEFNMENPLIEKARVRRKFIHPEFEAGRVPKNDVALLKLTRMTDTFRIIRMCRVEKDPGTWLETVGLGSTNHAHLELPSHLIETSFLQTRYKYASLFHAEPCEPELICTEPTDRGSSISRMDEGSPLYTYICDTRVPECLYGVASYFISDHVCTSPYQECTVRSFFAKVPHFYPWIGRTVVQND